MRRAMLALALVSLMSLAGCFGPSTAAWGTGTNAVEISMTQDTLSVKSTLSGSATSLTDLIPVGCTPGSEGGAATPAGGQPFTFEGYLAASAMYDAHNPTMGAKGLDYGVTTAIALQDMTFQNAAMVIDGEGARIDVKEWNIPLMPDTGSGSVDLDSIDQDTDSGWFILALLPTTESIHEGFKAFAEWHQPVKISGFLVTANSTSTGYYKESMGYTIRNDCSMDVGKQNREDFYVAVTHIQLENAQVTASGNADDEWVQGDVPVFGRAGYISLFLFAGIGGAVGAFIYSQRNVLASAKKDMKVLLGDAGLEKVAKVKDDMKAAKKAGMVSPEERRDEQRKVAEKAATSGPTPASKSSSDTIGTFDLDSVLASTSTNRQTSAPGQRKSSVVSSESSTSMRQAGTNIQSTRGSAPTTTQSFSTAHQAQAEQPTQRGPPQRTAPPTTPVRKKKTVSNAPSPNHEESNSPPPNTYDDEEDSFSNFSF